MKGDTGTSGWDLTLSSFGGCRLHPLLADRAAEWTGLPLRQGKDMLALLTFEPSSLAVNSYLAEEFLSALLLVGIPVAVITFFSAVVALLYPASAGSGGRSGKGMHSPNQREPRFRRVRSPQDVLPELITRRISTPRRFPQSADESQLGRSSNKCSYCHN